MIVYSNAKINIGLSVKDKRPDGYHNIESIFYPIPLNDIIEIIPAKEDSFLCTGIEIDLEDNLILSAIKLFREKFTIPPVYVHVHKQIPLGSGLGGGSSNASFTLILLNQLFDLKLSHSELVDCALELGSDCPFFIYNTPAMVKGRGELVSPIDYSLKDKFLKIVYPGFNSSTLEAFKNLKRHEKSNISDFHDSQDLSFLTNDFESGIFHLHPNLKEIKSDLMDEGAFYSSLTGTGSCVYGIFNERPKNSGDTSRIVKLN